MDLSAISDETLSVVMPLLRRQSATNKRVSVEEAVGLCKEAGVPYEPVLYLLGWRPRRGGRRRLWVDQLAPFQRNPETLEPPKDLESEAACEVSHCVLAGLSAA
jgi:hypothetical protein